MDTRRTKPPELQSARLADGSAREAIRKRDDQLGLLSDAAAQLLGVRCPIELLQGIYPRLAGHLDLDWWMHHVLHEQTESLVLRGHGGLPEELLESVKRLDFSAVLASRDNQPLGDDNGWNGNELQRRLGSPACFSYPLLVDGVILGTVSFGSFRRRRFNPPEVFLLRTISHYMGLALERNQLRGELTHRAERALKRSERQFRAIFETSPDCVVIVDDDFRILKTNPAAGGAFGLDAEVLIGRSLADFLRPADRVDEMRRKLLQTGRYAAELQILRPNSDAGDIDVGAAFSILPGRHLFVFHDITELKRAQRQLLELNNALEQRVRERTRSLLTYQEHLRAMTSELVLTEQRERRRLATELHDYLAQLLVASKMKSKVVSLHVEEPGKRGMEELRSLIDESLKYTRTLIADLSPTILYEAGFFAAMHWLGEQMQRHQLNVSIDQKAEAVDIPDDHAVMVFQAVRELLFNVVKHAGVEEAKVTLEQADDGQLQVTVEDHGAGFQVAGQQFEPAGGKFGLFSVRERLAVLGGSVDVESAPGRGTRAVVRLPLQPAPISEEIVGPSVRTAPPAAAGTRRRPGHVRVLLVDDHKMVREGFRSLIECDPTLEVAGEAANGEEAVELARLLQPDVVIMDINMPKMNGIEATRRIKQEMPEMAVIGLSVHDDRGLATTMLEAGAACYLTKGGPSEELSRAIHTTHEAQVGKSR